MCKSIEYIDKFCFNCVFFVLLIFKFGFFLWYNVNSEFIICMLVKLDYIVIVIICVVII